MLGPCHVRCYGNAPAVWQMGSNRGQTSRPYAEVWFHICEFVVECVACIVMTVAVSTLCSFVVRLPVFALTVVAAKVCAAKLRY